jgi:membrane protease YdiL (CAAX protease family)
MAATTGLALSIQSSLTTVAFVLVIAGIWAVVVRFYGKVPWRELRHRAGLTRGALRFHGVAALGLPVVLLLNHLMEAQLPAGEERSSPYAAFAGLGFSPLVLAAVFTYGMGVGGFAEELLFRGLIAGALGRRMALWKANLIQAFLFLLPHLLILLVAPEVWWLLVPFVSLLALALGWLRLRSSSIGPAMVLHGGGNTLVGLLYAGGAY